MKSNAQRKVSKPLLRAYLSLQGWALGILIEHGAVRNASTTAIAGIAAIRTHGTGRERRRSTHLSREPRRSGRSRPLMKSCAASVKTAPIAIDRTPLP